MLELVLGVSDVIDYVFDVDQFATLTQLKKVVEEMGDLVREVVEFVYERDERNVPSK